MRSDKTNLEETDTICDRFRFLSRFIFISNTNFGFESGIFWTVQDFILGKNKLFPQNAKVKNDLFKFGYILFIKMLVFLCFNQWAVSMAYLFKIIHLFAHTQNYNDKIIFHIKIFKIHIIDEDAIIKTL